MVLSRLTTPFVGRAGIIAPLTALSLTVIIGITAVAIDGGLMLTNRRRAQAAADAAALAAACELASPTGSASTAQTSALTTASNNGFTNDGTSSTVTVNIPPKQGDHVGDSNFAEVLVQWNQARCFSAIWGTGSVPVPARAVAGVASIPVAGGNGGIICLNPTVQKSLNVTGPGSVTVSSGGVIVESNNSNAAVITGDGSVITSEVDITGTGPGYLYSGKGYFDTTPTSGNIKTGKVPTPDPLASLPAPVATDYPTQSTKQLNINSTTILSPGRYIGGIGIAGGTITMLPGIYYMDHGGFSVSNGSVIGHGVMIYNDPDPGSGEKVTITGGTFDITAPTSGTYQGIAIFQARDAGQVPVAITGPGGSNMVGTVYAQSSPVQVTGAGGANVGSQFIADTLTVTGAGNFTVDWKGAASPPQLKKQIHLVE